MMKNFKCTQTITANMDEERKMNPMVFYLRSMEVCIPSYPPLFIHNPMRVTQGQRKCHIFNAILYLLYVRIWSCFTNKMLVLKDCYTSLKKSIYFSSLTQTKIFFSFLCGLTVFQLPPPLEDYYG